MGMCVLIGLVIFPSVAWSHVACVVLQILPMIMEIAGIGLIIRVIPHRPEPSVKHDSIKENHKVLVRYPECWMILLMLMVSTYTYAMCLTWIGWWWCIKHKPPDPVSPITGSMRWTSSQQHQCKTLTNPLILALLMANTIASKQIPTITLRSHPLRKWLYKYSDNHG